MHVFRSIAVAVVLCIGLQTSGHAANDPSSPGFQLNTRQAEVMVFVTDNCTYCAVFERDIAPAYRRSGRGKVAPLRFIDIANADWNDLGLSEPITVVPTAVVVVEGREVARVPGYTVPRLFFRIVNRALQQPH